MGLEFLDYSLGCRAPLSITGYQLKRARIFRRRTLRRKKKVLVSVRFFFLTAKCPTAKNPRAVQETRVSLSVRWLPKSTCFIVNLKVAWLGAP